MDSVPSVIVKRMMTRDVEDQAAALPGWVQEYRQLQAGRFQGELLLASIPGGSLFRERSNLRLQQLTAPPPGMIVIGTLAKGSAPVRVNGRTVVPGQLLVLSRPEACDLLCAGPFDIVALSVERAFLARAGHAVSSSVEGGFCGPVSCPAAMALHDWLHQCLAELGSAPGLVAPHPRATEALSSALADRCAQALEAAFGDIGDMSLRTSAPHRYAIVAQTRERLDDGSDDLLTVAQVAAAIGVSTRLLEYSFAEVVGMSPYAYLRSIRLNAARRDLRAADPTVATVADIAMKWGFWHLGRFSSYYRMLFGENPSETLHAGRVLSPPARKDPPEGHEPERPP